MINKKVLTDHFNCSKLMLLQCPMKSDVVRCGQTWYRCGPDVVQRRGGSSGGAQGARAPQTSIKYTSIGLYFGWSDERNQQLPYIGYDRILTGCAKWSTGWTMAASGASFRLSQSQPPRYLSAVQNSLNTSGIWSQHRAEIVPDHVSRVWHG